MQKHACARLMFLIQYIYYERTNTSKLSIGMTKPKTKTLVCKQNTPTTKFFVCAIICELATRLQFHIHTYVVFISSSFDRSFDYLDTKTIQH